MIEQFTIVELGVLGSTQDEAFALIESGKASNGVGFSADNQTYGRGRQQKKWVSAEGNIHMSLILEPSVNQAAWSQISYIVGESLAEALLQIDSKLSIELKWVNDILVEGKKVAGILLEKRDERFLVVGIGVNIVRMNLPTDGAPAESLISYSQEFTKEKTIELFLARFKVNYNTWLKEGFLPIKHMWLKRARGIGKHVIVSNYKKSIEGVFLGIDDEGNMQLLKDNQVELISAGKLYFKQS